MTGYLLVVAGAAVAFLYGAWQRSRAERCAEALKVVQRDLATCQMNAAVETRRHRAAVDELVKMVEAASRAANDNSDPDAVRARLRELLTRP